MKFLIGYNGSAEARAALSLARDFAKIFNAKVFVMASMEGGAGEKIEDINQAEQNDGQGLNTGRRSGKIRRRKSNRSNLCRN
jgi:hypothetical protein